MFHIFGKRTTRNRTREFSYGKHNGGRQNRRCLQVETLEQRQLLTATLAVQSGSWDDPTTWDNGVPDETSRAIVSEGITVTLDGTDHVADEIVVHGVLDVLESANSRTLTTDWIHVNSGGVFQVGTEANRFDTSTFTLTLTGTDITANHTIETATGTMNVIDNDGFLMTAMGGRLQFFGEEKLSFTKLAETANRGASSITVENIIERNFDGTTSVASDGQLNWNVGDTIVIASSETDYRQEEVRTVIGINNQGSETVLTLDSPLESRHYGEIETYGNAVRNWDIDMRAEVARLNRSITIQGTQDTDDVFGDRANYGTGAGENLGIGAHAMVMPGSGQITIDGVNFDKMGQTAQLGRYPIHWHVAGDRTGDVMRNSSVTNSNNRGIVIHGTQGVLMEGNVLHDIHGHGFFMEDAAETGNRLLNNITFGIHKVGGGTTSNDPFVVPGITRGADGRVNGLAPQNENGESSHDTGQNAFRRFNHSAAYWITNPDNTFVGNVSAGSEGSGFWFAIPSGVIGLSKDTGLYDNLRPDRSPLRQFDHNTSHSAPVGLTFDRGEDIKPGSSNHFSNGTVNYLTAYKHDGSAVYHRGVDFTFNESRFADNANSSFNTFTQLEQNILFVGHSRGNSNPNMLVGGYRLYDGPGRIVDSHFAGFAADNAHTFRIEGGANKHTHTRAEGITFEDDGTANHLSIEFASNDSISTNESPTFVAGNPTIFAGAVQDVDGSLTGHVGGGPGYTLTPKIDFYRDSTDLAPEGWNAFLSDDRYGQLKIGTIANGGSLLGHTGVVDGENIPVFRITNGDGHVLLADRFNLTFVQRLYAKMNAGDYTVEFLGQLAESGFDVVLDARSGAQSSDSTVLRFVDVGRNHKPTSGTEVSSLAALRSSSNTSYFRDPDGDLWMKIRQSNRTINIDSVSPILVTNTNDSGAGSLRNAIIQANANSGIDTIAFDIGDGGVQTIKPQSPLPTITERVYIDGLTQPVQTSEVVIDNGFENPLQPANHFEQSNGTGDGTLAGSFWTINDGAGITRNFSAFQNSRTPAPEGRQHALIQQSGSFQQTITSLEVGNEYQFSLSTMARLGQDFGNNLVATLDKGLPTELELINIPEVTFDAFTEVSSQAFVPSKTSYTLTIESNRNNGVLTGDRTTFFDDVQVRKVEDIEAESLNRIVIDGSQAGGGNGLEISAGMTGVNSLSINHFASGAGIHLSGSGGHVVDNIWTGFGGAGTAISANQIGVRIDSEGNTVRNSRLRGNATHGVMVGIGVGNTITTNQIFDNGSLGIDLGNDGVTANDHLDRDSGANGLTNFPELTLATSGESPNLRGQMNGEANTQYRLEFFASDQLDPTSHGEAQRYLGATTVTTNVSGLAAFDVFLESNLTTGQFVTATAIDPSGSTSEFSGGISATPPGSLDYGDAPPNYSVTRENNGAFHTAVGPRLGPTRDTESDGIVSATAEGDDLTGSGDDEDGALFGGIGVTSSIAGLNVLLENATTAKVDAWIDFNRDGDWDDVGEKILNSVTVDQPMQTLNYDLPSGLISGHAIARVRLSSAGGLAPTGGAIDGEVEDYVVQITSPPIVQSVELNRGDAQRSSLKSVKVTFDRVVDIEDSLGDPFTFTHVASGESVLLISDTNHSSGKTVVELTFNADSPHVTSFGSLEDGNYRMTINPQWVTYLGIQLDGDDDGVAGGEYSLEAIDGLFRKYGDDDGDGSVGLTDFASFRSTFGASSGDSSFREGLDADGNGRIGLTDFAAFRGNFGR